MVRPPQGLSTNRSLPPLQRLGTQPGKKETRKKRTLPQAQQAGHFLREAKEVVVGNHCLLGSLFSERFTHGPGCLAVDYANTICLIGKPKDLQRCPGLPGKNCSTAYRSAFAEEPPRPAAESKQKQMSVCRRRWSQCKRIFTQPAVQRK